MQGDDESVNLLLGVIHGEGGTDGHLIAQSTQGWLGAVMTCTYCYAFLVEQLSHLGSRNARNVERDDADTLLGVTDDGDARYARYLLACVLGELVFVALYVVDAYGVDEVEGVAKTYGIGNVWCVNP